MEALPTAAVMLDQHPPNDIVHTESNSGQNNRSWIPNYHPISNLIVHTTISLDGVVNATYEAGFLPEGNDDRLRLNAIALPPNKREWHLLSVADRELWFHTEISNIVLAVWSQYPTVLQTSHSRPHEVSTPADEVATAYSIQRGSSRAFLVVGEIRKNVINRDVWQSGNLTTKATQNRLSQELRGYVHDKPPMLSRLLDPSGVHPEEKWLTCPGSPATPASFSARRSSTLRRIGPFGHREIMGLTEGSGLMTTGLNDLGYGQHEFPLSRSPTLGTYLPRRQVGCYLLSTAILPFSHKEN